mgnify:FL=1
MKLGKQGSAAFNGALHDLREKGNIYRIDSKMPFRRDFSPIYIDEIADRLEQVKGNSDGERELKSKGLHGDGKPLQQRRHIFGKEIQVFEEKQKAHTEQNGQDEGCLSRRGCPPALSAVRGFIALFPCALHIQSRVIGNDGGEKENENIFRSPGSIEKIAGSKQQHPAPFSGNSPV